MTPQEARDTAEEIAPWALEERRAYLENLAMHNADDAEQIKAELKRIWEKR